MSDVLKPSPAYVSSHRLGPRPQRRRRLEALTPGQQVLDDRFPLLLFRLLSCRLLLFCLPSPPPPPPHFSVLFAIASSPAPPWLMHPPQRLRWLNPLPQIKHCKIDATLQVQPPLLVKHSVGFASRQRALSQAPLPFAGPPSSSCPHSVVIASACPSSPCAS